MRKITSEDMDEIIAEAGTIESTLKKVIDEELEWLKRENDSSTVFTVFNLTERYFVETKECHNISLSNGERFRRLAVSVLVRNGVLTSSSMSLDNALSKLISMNIYVTYDDRETSHDNVYECIVSPLTVDGRTDVTIVLSEVIPVYNEHTRMIQDIIDYYHFIKDATGVSDEIPTSQEIEKSINESKTVSNNFVNIKIMPLVRKNEI